MTKITIKNGTGNANVKPGLYCVTGNIPGYENNTIDPNIIKVGNKDNYELKISASGTLTIHVTEDNCQNKPIKDVKFARTDAKGNIYGNPIITNENGNAVFKNVPYGKDAPYIYFKQISNNQLNESNEKVQYIKMKDKNETINIKNKTQNFKTFTLVDKNYGNLPISGTLILK